MTWLFVASAAQLLLGLSSVLDKLLLQRIVPDPWVFTFWWGALGAFALALLPFGATPIALSYALIALAAGVLFSFAMLNMFHALARGDAGVVFPFIGALSPISSVFFSTLFLGGGPNGWEWLGFVLLIGGMVVFLLTEWRRTPTITFLFSALAALSFSASYVLSKIVFDASSFTTGFILIKLGGAGLAIAFLLAPTLRARIFASHKETHATGKFAYVGNRTLAAGGSVLVSYAVSLGHPALVDATQGLRFVIVFIAGCLVLRERSVRWRLAGKLTATALVIAGLAATGLVHYARALPPPDPHRPVTWGVTFSMKFARQLGLDWRENLEAIFVDLKPKKIRLIAYWDMIERKRGRYHFDDLDWQIQKAGEYGSEVILAVGMKVPRWPECHIPEWAKELSTQERERALRIYLTEVFTRYASAPYLKIWQLENEPFLLFGKCPERPKRFLDEEITLLRSVDPARPILTTDGGEFGTWYPAAKRGDVFGTTLYRRVYPPSIGTWSGVIEYPISPAFFRLKKRMVRFFLGDERKPFIVIELQAEPWGKYELFRLPYGEHINLFGIDYFRETLEFARQTGFSEYYLWGAEWWYFLKEQHGDAQYWDEVKELMRQ